MPDEYDSPPPPKPLFRRRRYRVSFKFRAADPYVLDHQQVTIDTPEAFVDAEQIEVLVCAHGHVIHNDTEIGGICSGRCGRYLCGACARKLHCSYCGNLVCRDCATVRVDRVVCQNHGFLRCVWEELTGGQDAKPASDPAHADTTVDRPKRGPARRPDRP